MASRGFSASRTAFGALCVALIVLFLAISNVFPSLDLTLSALAALIVYVLLLEFGRSTALIAYFAAGILASLLLPDKNCALFFLAFFGWYPFLRSALSKLPLVFSWAIKILCAVCAGALFFYIFYFLFPLPTLKEFFQPIVILLFLIAFILYEIGLSQLLLFYHSKLRPKLFRK